MMGLAAKAILASYKHEKIEAYISAQKRLKNSTKIIVESEPRGTGGALKNADSVKDLEEADKDLRTCILSGPSASNH
ncbi:MAG: hypothetical protein QW774_03470 [Candidatus Micrarchaeaceae archaeon]